MKTTVTIKPHARTDTSFAFVFVSRGDTTLANIGDTVTLNVGGVENSYEVVDRDISYKLNGGKNDAGADAHVTIFVK